MNLIERPGRMRCRWIFHIVFCVTLWWVPMNLCAQEVRLGMQASELWRALGNPPHAADTSYYRLTRRRFYGDSAVLQIVLDSDHTVSAFAYAFCFTKDSQFKASRFIAVEDSLNRALRFLHESVNDNGDQACWFDSIRFSILRISDSNLVYVADRRANVANYWDSAWGYDSSFSVGMGATPVNDNERTLVATWKHYLSTWYSPYERAKHWSRFDPFGDDLAAFEMRPLSIRYARRTARLKGLAYDSELGGYVLITTFERPPDSSDTQPTNATRIVFAVVEDDIWKFTSALPVTTRGWATVQTPLITYHHRNSTKLHFDSAEAIRANAFVGKVATEFGIAPPKSIDYYYGMPRYTSPYELIGLTYDYTVSGFTTQDGRVISLCDTTPFDRHELTHAAVSQLRLPRIVNEGLANFMEHESPDTLQQYSDLAPALDTMSIPPLEELWDPPEGSKTHAWMYFCGELIIRAVIDQHGRQALPRFIKACDNRQHMLSAFKEWLGLTPEVFQGFVRYQVKRLAAGAGDTPPKQKR